MSYTIESIAECIGARRVGECEATIDWLLTDSRSLSFPEETLFFALTTKRNSGARYIPDLYDRGVRNFVVTEEDFEKIKNGELGKLSTLNFLIHFILHSTDYPTVRFLLFSSSSYKPRFFPSFPPRLLLTHPSTFPSSSPSSPRNVLFSCTIVLTSLMVSLVSANS